MEPTASAAQDARLEKLSESFKAAAAESKLALNELLRSAASAEEHHMLLTAGLRSGTPLHDAVRTGHDESVNVLLLQASDASERRQMLFATGNAGHIPLMTAVVWGNSLCTLALLRCSSNKNKRAMLAATDSRGFSPLHLAVEAGNERCLIDLLEEADEVGSKHDVILALSNEVTTSSTPLHVAAHQGHAGCVRALLDGASNAEERHEMLNARNLFECIPLHSATWGNVGCVRAILDYLGCEERKKMIMEKNRFGSLPLHDAAHVGDEDIIRALLEQGALGGCQRDMILANSGEDVGRVTPLHLAAKSGHDACVGVLLQQAALTGCQDDMIIAPTSKEMLESTALHVAVVQGHVECVLVLLACPSSADAQRAVLGAKEDDDSRQPVTQEWRARLLTAKNSAGNTPLHFAVRRSYNCLRELLKSAPGPAYLQMMLSMPNHFGDLPLHEAAKVGFAECGRTLLKSTGSSQECFRLLVAANKGGNTALHLAASVGHEDFAKMLLFEFAASADALTSMLEAKNRNRKTAADVAKYGSLRRVLVEVEEASQKKGTLSTKDTELSGEAVVTSANTAEEDVPGRDCSSSNGLTAKGDIDEARSAAEDAMRRSDVMDMIETLEQAEAGLRSAKRGGAPEAPTVATEENTSSSGASLPAEAGLLHLALSKTDKNDEDQVEDEGTLHADVKDEDRLGGEPLSEEGGAASSTRRPVLQRQVQWNTPTCSSAQQEASEMASQLQDVRGSCAVVGRSQTIRQDEVELSKAQSRAVEKERDEALALVASLTERVNLLEEKVKLAELEEREMRKRSRLLQEEREAFVARMIFLEGQSQQVPQEICKDSATAASAGKAGTTAARGQNVAASSNATQPLAAPAAPSGMQRPLWTSCYAGVMRRIWRGSSKRRRSEAARALAVGLAEKDIIVDQAQAAVGTAVLEDLGASNLEDLLKEGDDEDVELSILALQLKKLQLKKLREARARR